MKKYSLDGKSESRYEPAQLIDLRGRELPVKIWPLQYLKKDADKWETAFGETVTKGVAPYNLNLYSSPASSFEREGIVFEFSKLKTEKDINDFAMKYGQLGLYLSEDADDFRIKEEKFGRSYLEMVSTEGFSYFEPLQMWWFYIDLIQKNLKLYRALVNNHLGEKREIEDNILRIDYNFLGENAETLGHYFVSWYDGQKTYTIITQKEAETLDFVSLGRRVLIDNIERMASRNIQVKAASIIDTNKPPLGFTLIEDRVTPHLLTAIYYDFWQLISKNQPVHICENPNCKLPFNKTGRRKFCSNACKQEAYLIRKGVKEIEKAQPLKQE